MAGSRTELPLSARARGLTACRVCSRVAPFGTEQCKLCGTRLHSRCPNSLQKLWAWWIAGLICYVHANLFPMLITKTVIGTSQSTIVGGAMLIIHHGDWPVALIILVASVAIPVGKFAAIAYLALSVNRHSHVSASTRHHLYEIVEFIGRWSMIDVFVVAILSALVQLSAVAQIKPGPAAMTFACSVICTMIAALHFDSRLIWDKDREEQSQSGLIKH